jgi:hypothetical protein
MSGRRQSLIVIGSAAVLLLWNTVSRIGMAMNVDQYTLQDSDSEHGGNDWNIVQDRPNSYKTMKEFQEIMENEMRKHREVSQAILQRLNKALEQEERLSVGINNAKTGSAQKLEDPDEAFSIEGRSPVIPLEELTGSREAESQVCPEGLVLVKDTVLDPGLLYQGGRKIPRLVHSTSLSRCNAKVIADNIDDWRFTNYSLFFYDDPAVERLLYRDWPEFPLLHKVLACLPNKGAIMADIWRVLALWEYGGIYTDMDTGVIPHMFNGTSITAEDDGFFAMAPLGIPTQWFMAVSPRHPMMYFAMKRIIINLLRLDDIGNFPVVFTTGPAVIGDAFRIFIGSKEKRFLAGRYIGLNNRSATIVGNKDNMTHFVRSVIKGNMAEKNKVYQQSGMTHISHMGLRKKKLGSCLLVLYEKEKAAKMAV